MKPDSNCKIVGIIHPLFETDSNPFFIENQLKFISNKLFSSIETASDNVSMLRHCCKPREVFLECATREEDYINDEMKPILLSLYTFLDDHRYEPGSIYGDDEEFGEELKQIPKPQNEPLKVIADLLVVLKTMGPYCADKAALTLLYTVEKLKVKTPYERHYVLLCIVSTLLIHIRSTFEGVFDGYSNEESIMKFSSPRVLRLISVLKQFKPKSFKAENKTEAKKEEKEKKEKKDIVAKTKSPKKNWKLARRYGTHRKQSNKRSKNAYEETVCAIILVNDKVTASILYYMLLVSNNILLI